MKSIDLHTLATAMLSQTPPAPVPAADDAGRKADRLGLLHSVIAQAKAEAESLRAELEETGLNEINGQLYRVAFASCAGATRIDWQTIAKKFKPSRQLIAAHTSIGKESVRMTVTARPTH